MFAVVNEAAVARRAGLLYEDGHEIPLFSLNQLQMYTLFRKL